MKLINWHRFTEATIEFGSSTLLSGENGAGKSTLLDAIQFVVTCSTNYFNKAAHENGKRKLTGYIRCKTGKENKPYERTGEISAHVALEFYEESRKQYFVVGAVIDSASEGQETVARYLMDNTRFTDDMFFQGSTPKSIVQFRNANPKIKQWCKTQAEAKKVMKTRFGRIEDKFFTLIPKALAFKPIDDIKDFVYSYVLDEKEVNIDILRENVRTYQELEKTLESVKKKIDKLEKIEEAHTEVMEGMMRDKKYEFFLSHAEVDLIKESIIDLENEIQADGFRLQEREKQRVALSKEKEEKQEIETALRVELKQNKDFLALEEQEKELKRLEQDKEEREKEKGVLLKSVKKALEQCYKLTEVKDVNPCIKDYQVKLERLEAVKELTELKQLVQAVITYKNEMREKIQRKLLEVQLEQQRLTQEKQEQDEIIEKLNRKKLTYSSEVTLVMEQIREEFARIGRKPEPRILCELLEIKDEAWRNAVEGYLNTQRFYILVEPEHFDIALGIYDRLRAERKAFGVGLINARKLDDYKTAPEGTLATQVTSSNKYAKQYINMVLGKVQMCERYDQLKNYSIAITKECMRYQNHVASAIKPSVFETPFIGKNAFRMQLLQAEARRKKLIEEIDNCQEKLKNLDFVLHPLATEQDVDIKYRLDVLSDLRNLQNAILKCKANIDTLKKNATMIQKQIQLDTLGELIKELDANIGKLNNEMGQLEEKVRSKKEQQENYRICQIEQQSLLSRLTGEAGELFGAWKQEYDKLTEQRALIQFRDNFERRRKANDTTTSDARNKMTDAMIQYKTEHDFGAAPSMEGYPEFEAVYDRLKNSELLSYEGKVQAARQAAEEEFREQFLAKLQENMKQAQGEFKELNKALRDIVFSNEKYEFLYLPSKRYRQYYEMIMDDFNAIQGESIFSGVFHENHKEVIDELFDRLALDSENSTKALDEFTDYRTYMDYDIRIVHSDDSYSFYSKVCEEKSGGETQTPFYVTVAASFVQLYGNNIGGEAIGLVMFDEAFNNMDDERIGGVLEFLRRLPLQIIIAAPPDKIQYISPGVEETLLVMTDEKVSFVERYVNGTL
ncbi:MAG: cell division protein MukB [Acetatifactor sp.]|nr:cell division protein MukB [Acetatifactor sp.]